MIPNSAIEPECGTVGEIAAELMMDTRMQAITDDYEEEDEEDNV